MLGPEIRSVASNRCDFETPDGKVYRGDDHQLKLNFYTVDGKLIKGQPTKRGIYIVNGRKVVVK